MTDAWKELRRRARQQEALARLGQHVLDETTLASLFERTADLAASALGSEFCKILELRHDGQLLLRGGAGWSQGHVGHTLVPGESRSHAGYVLLTGQPVFVRDYRAETRFRCSPLLHEHGVVSGVSVPLGGEPRPFGVLSVHSCQVTDYHPDEISFLQHVALVLAAALRRFQQDDRLRQSQRLETVGRLVTGVAHDFNNLLTVIAGYSELMLSLPETAASSRPMIADVLRAAERAASLNRWLLAFPRAHGIAYQILNLNALVTDSVRLLHRLLGQDIDLVTDLHPDLGAIHGDRHQIEQVLINLAVNARDAMPQGGRLTIETSNVERPDGDHPPRMGKAGSFVLLAVRDTGIGMTPETAARMFEPFFTTMSGGTHTGLGLATVQGVVTQMGGTIEVDTAPNLGTTFRVYLPASEPARVLAKLPPEIEAPKQDGTTVLLVEPDDDVRTLTRRMLEHWGYRVLEARCGADALHQVEQHHETIDVLLVEAVMPEQDGRQTAARIASQKPGIRVLYTSGASEEILSRHGMLNSEVALLQKPYSPRMLASKLREVLER